jgi:hypothetical protein
MELLGGFLTCIHAISRSNQGSLWKALDEAASTLASNHELFWTDVEGRLVYVFWALTPGARYQNHTSIATCKLGLAMGELKIPLRVSRKSSKHQNTREGTLKRTKRGQSSEQQKKIKNHIQETKLNQKEGKRNKPWRSYLRQRPNSSIWAEWADIQSLKLSSRFLSRSGLIQVVPISTSIDL